MSPGAIRIAAAADGDPHLRGRAAVIYKPRSLDLHRHFSELVDWLNDKTGLDIRTVDR